MLNLNVLSSGKDIKLHDFPTLESKYTFKRSLVDTRTLFAFPRENIFVSVYQDNRVDLLKAYKTDNGSSNIKRIKKFKLDGVTCGSVMSQDGKNEIAMGLSNGTIAFVDFNTKEMIDRKFSSDAFGNSVVDISFNNDYSVLGSTYERGEVQLFDMKIKRKMYRYKLDMKSDLVQFHPTNPQLLAVTSLAGGISVLNINIKKATYSNSSAHRMYSKGICWSPSSASILMSVANDCHMKIFDVRQSVTVAQTKHTYPYSTLAISSCGNFCCAGDMKGSIMSYDLRKISTVLYSNRSHEGSSINKIFFPPCSVDTDSNVYEGESEVDYVIDQGEIEGSSNRRMSGLDFIDAVHPSKAPKEKNRRTSMDDFFDLCESKFVNNEKKSDSPLDTLNTVVEENVTGGTSNSHNGSSMEIEFNESRMNPKNRRSTLLPSELQQMYYDTRKQGRVVCNGSVLKPSNVNELNKVPTSGSSQSLYPDNKENYNNELPQNQLITERNNEVAEFAYARSNAAFISQMNEMSEKIQNLETRLDNTMFNVTEKILSIEKKLDAKMEDLSAQIQQGFLSIHCNLWAVAESDIANIKTMVSTIHENYRKIEDVFLENASLKEQLNNVKSNKNQEV